MNIYKISGIKNETYRITRIEETDHLPYLQKYLIDRNFDGKIYHMSRVIDGTRKKAQSIICYKAAKHDTFIAVG